MCHYLRVVAKCDVVCDSSLCLLNKLYLFRVILVLGRNPAGADVVRVKSCFVCLFVSSFYFSSLFRP